MVSPDTLAIRFTSNPSLKIFLTILFVLIKYVFFSLHGYCPTNYVGSSLNYCAAIKDTTPLCTDIMRFDDSPFVQFPMCLFENSYIV